MSEAVTREEALLNAISTGKIVDIVPVTRKEKYLRYLAGIGEKPSKPITREEMFLDKIQAGGSGGGEASVLDSLIDRSITKISSNVSNVGDYAFMNCFNLTTADFPLVKSIGYASFDSCNNLTTVNFPLATSIGRESFYNCYNLTTADFPLVKSIGSTAFYNCYKLKALILRNETICPLSNTATFSGCYHILGTTNATYNPNGDKDGYIYVPRSLVESYQSATNWSTYASQFRALEDYTVDGTITGELDESKI